MLHIHTKPDAVLLDWDDHLVDSVAYYEMANMAALNYAMDVLGYDAPLIPYRERPFGQKSSDYFIAQYGPEKARRIIEKREEMFMGDSLPPPTLRPGARELLKFLEINNIPYAIASDTIQERLEHNVARAFELAGLPTAQLPPLIGTSKTMPKKPDPALIVEALRQLSERNGIDLQPSERVLMSGDKPDKDGMCAQNAGISHSIIIHEKSGDVTGWNTYESLLGLVSELAATVGQEVRAPRFIKRGSYAGVPREETEVVTGHNHFVEAPHTNVVDPASYSDEQRQFHQKRMIAKRAINLDGTGNYTREDQMEAAHEVIQEMLTPDILNELIRRTVVAVEKKLEGGADPDKENVVYLPHLSILPVRPMKNVLTIAYNEELTRALNDIVQSDDFQRNHPNIHVRFDNSRVLSSLTMHKAEEIAEGTTEIETQGLSGRDTRFTITEGRTTSTLLERIVKQPVFDYSMFNAGDLVIVPDDHVQHGSTFTAFYHGLKERGAAPIAFTAMAIMPESRNLQGHADVKADMATALHYAVEDYLLEYSNAKPERIQQKFEKALDDMLGKVGLSVDTLSNREALTVMAYLINGTKPEQLQWFEQVADKYGADLSIVERKDESLKLQAEQLSVTPVMLLEDVERLIPKFTVRHR